MEEPALNRKKSTIYVPHSPTDFGEALEYDVFGSHLHRVQLERAQASIAPIALRSVDRKIDITSFLVREKDGSLTPDCQRSTERHLLQSRGQQDRGHRSGDEGKDRNVVQKKVIPCAKTFRALGACPTAILKYFT